MLLFQLIKFILHFVYFGLNLSPSVWRVHGNASSIANKISCHCCCVNCSCYWQETFPQTNPSRNAVESSSQSLLDLGEVGGAVWGKMNKGSEELEPIIIWDRKLRSWDGSMVRKTEENVIQRIFLRNTVPVLCALRKWLWNTDGWARRWTVKLVRDSGRVLNGAPQFVGRKGSYSGKQGATKLNVRIFCLPGFVADRTQIYFSHGIFRASSFMCETHSSCHISFLDFSIRIFHESHTI